MKHSDEAFDEADMDMTPMIDVVFLLIIFFLCIDFRVLEAKLPAYLPTDRGSSNVPSEPVEQLAVRIEVDEFGEKRRRRPDDPDSAFYLVGHRVRWQVNTRRFTDLDGLRDHLAEIARDPTRTVPDDSSPGGRKLMAVVIEPQPGAVYGDVAATVDAVRAAEFEDIHFGGGRGSLNGD